jgi:hypothetical protein
MSISQNSSKSTAVREDYRGVNQYLSQNVSGRDLIVVSAPFTIYPIEYHYLGPARIVTLPEWDRFSQAMPGFDEQQMIDQIKSYQGVYEKVYFVLSYDQGYEEKITNHLASNYQLLDEIAFRPSIDVLIYKFRYD